MAKENKCFNNEIYESKRLDESLKEYEFYEKGACINKPPFFVMILVCLYK